jgi:integrase
MQEDSMKKLYYLTARSSGIYYYKLKGQQHFKSTGKKNKQEAVEFVEKIMNGEPESKEKVLLSEFTKDMFIWDKCTWTRRRVVKGKQLSKPTVADRRSMLKNYILPTFGNRIISSIKNHEIDNWLTTLPLANSTRNQVLFTFRIVLREAIFQNIINENQAEKVETYATKDSQNSRDAFNAFEIPQLFPDDNNKLLEIWDTYFNATLCYLALTTGMRNGEVRALKWKDIIFDNDVLLKKFKQEHQLSAGYVRINRSSRANNSIGTTKNGKIRASLIIPRAKELLLKHKESSPYTNLEDFVFTLNGINIVWSSLPLEKLKKAMIRAGIKTEGRNLVFHSLRHTFVTLSRGNKIDETLLKDTVGHTDLKVTNIYDHNDKQFQLILTLLENREQIEKVFDTPKQGSINEQFRIHG